ncbi:MAG: hypothetical protein LBD68_07600 [Zoogloeaceae bacterium]|jgi:hypothetical protein|nr:hypothetical protein [Zoogloeaceae bacterium]
MKNLKYINPAINQKKFPEMFPVGDGQSQASAGEIGRFDRQLRLRKPLGGILSFAEGASGQFTAIDCGFALPATQVCLPG